MFLILRLVLITLLLPGASFAQVTYVPPDLQDWQQWVLKDKEYRECPFFFNRGAAQPGDFVCAWPGLLELSVDANRGQFAQRWTVYADEQWLALPGNDAYWPHQVTVDGRSVAVVAHNGLPSVYLGPGNYRIAGSFEWDERPGFLGVPQETGLIALAVNGQAVARPERNRAGIFLGERKQETRARDAVDARVYRLIRDDVPTRLTTQLRIDVSGSVREELFGALLPEGFVPLAIGSQLPARLEPDGNLRVQVRPGSWVIELTARGSAVLNTLAMPEPGSNLPDTEIWSYQSNDSLRVTAAEGLPPVDPRQANAPPGWQQLPAFRVEPGAKLTLVERSRGIVSAQNELTLARQMWLDFDGTGFVVSDDIGGAMRVDWRLDMGLPYALLNAAEGEENLLITDGQQEGQTGVELRRNNVALDALGRVNARGSIPATGWDARFARAAAVVHLPPGHKLLAAPGVDDAPKSWVSQWQLLDYFLVLIITIGTWRLFGRTAGVIALAALTLSFHEPNSPAWLWLNVLIAVALMRVAPAGRLRQSVGVYQALSAVLLILALVPFLASQLRVAIYPQLEQQYGTYDPGRLIGRGGVADLQSPADDYEADSVKQLSASRPAGAMKVDRPQVPAEMVLDEVAAQAARSAGFYAYSRYAPNAIVQAGPGKPSWNWNSYLLSWSGPVDAGQTMRLMILPRWAVTSLRFVEVIMLLLFAAVLAAEVLRRRIRLPGGMNIGRAQASSVLALVFMAALMSASPAAEAQTPAPELLRELENRLLEPPDCVPRCAEIVAADVDVKQDNVRITLTVHALENVAIPLPGSERGWRPAAILIDGTATAEILRGHDETLWARLAQGRHTIALSGPASATDNLEIPFPTPPRVIEVKGDGWFVAGVKDRRLLSGSLQLTRLQRDGADSTAVRWESSRFPAFVEIRRTIRFDLDWTVETIVSRIAPQQGALTLEVPLVDGESVLSEGVTVKDGKALVSMNPNQRVVSWSSGLPRKSPMTLSMTAGVPWQEIWGIGAGSIWHAEFSGVPESETAVDDFDARTALFYPRGGETLTIRATRPEPSQGSTLAFDSVGLSVEHGNRSSTSGMSLNYRSTRGAQHVLRLPEDAEVTQVVIDGDLEPLRAEAGELTVPILPGEHTIGVTWRSSGDVAARSATPAVDIGAPASNISLSVELPANRWVLATNGPRLGPAVLYWSELAVLLLAAIILGRVELTPLKTRHWVLVGLGFSTFSWPALAMVVVWLLACGARGRWDGETSWWRFNAVQVLIAILTITALSAIVSSLPGGLLGTPDMQVTGNGSYGNSLRWFADRSDSALPTAMVWSVPLWIYKVLILSWALWLSFALLRWLPWVWQCFASQGFWRPRRGGVIRGPEGAE